MGGVLLKLRVKPVNDHVVTSKFNMDSCHSSASDLDGDGSISDQRPE